ncbi:LysR family transcriptional regulator [Acinetobacter pittii]|uniref:LysR family transcriptional regulator n=1 Tax=Acinetobacter pittii TaxID=48296 RepID=UPI0034CD05AE
MNLINGIEAFVYVADMGSFAKAARQLNISPSAVSKLIAKTEEELGTRLFNRNTRGLSITQEGEVFLEHSRVILSELDAAKQDLSTIANIPRGKLRISLPNIPSFFVPIISNFMEHYPSINLELDFSDRVVDVIEEGFDIVIRVGQLVDSRLTAKPLGNFRMNLVAAPTYLNKFGVPSSVEDLDFHHCIQYRYPSTGRIESWSMHKTFTHQQSTNFPAVCNCTDARMSLALQGRGIALLPQMLTNEYTASGMLEIVLSGIVERNYEINLVWPTNKHATPRLKAFIEFFSEYFNKIKNN